MPEKNATLSMHKISWNSRSKLNLAQCFKQVDTHKIKVYSQKKILKLYPESYLVEWWMMHLVSCEFSSLKLNFYYPPLTLVVAISKEKFNPHP
jgi:hypothetical protein